MSTADLFPEARATPMMQQYLAAKRQHPDALLFYRMGDFYEMFFDDALIASRVLDIALTRRGQHQGVDVPMCGVPFHSHTAYVARLIRAGHRVALCEQVETPEEAKKRGSKALVERRVVRVITPGTLTEDTLLNARSSNYVAALVPAGVTELALAWADISTGQFMLETISRPALGAALARVAPSELLLPEVLATMGDIRAALAESNIAETRRPLPTFDVENCRARLLAFYKVATLDAFGIFSEAEVTAAGALLDYIQLTQVGALPALQPLRGLAKGGLLEIDAATRRNLELTETAQGDRAGSLLQTIDETATAAGARLLAARLSAPLTDVALIQQRLAAVTFMHQQTRCREKVRDLLQRCPDLERALGRLALGRGGPRDLAALREGLRVATDVAALLASEALPAELAEAAAAMAGHHSLIETLTAALAAELPLLVRDGGFIAAGYAALLDQKRSLRDEGRRLIAALQARYLAETGLSALKIKHNNIIGYHVELSAQQADKLMAGPQAGTFIHRQTMAGAVRFTTTELATLEREMAEAADRALAIEIDLFEQLRQQVLAVQGSLLEAASALARVDVAAALAELAVRAAWCCPVVDGSLAFAVVGGRHPVVEAALKRQASAPFVANDCTLASAQRLWLLTGPNMAGKSTFLRQNALLVVLAQMGSYVPAVSAHIGVVDRLFSRVGAADDLARGRSTFMVEMVETATILNLASERSLVILDEIGRGTATFDGLSIAWAVVEYLHNQSRCRGLFATHYHELTVLSDQLPELACFTMAVKEWQDDVIFLHHVEPGMANRSYGLHVGKLAGLPPAVLTRAASILGALEAGSAIPKKAAAEPLPRVDEVRAALAATQPDNLSPKEALELLYSLKALAAR